MRTRHGVLLWLVCLCITATAAEPRQPLTGRLTDEQGVTVLELWGTPAEAGYTQGYLLADRILGVIDGYMLAPEILPNTAFYNAVIVAGVDTQFAWPADAEAELGALFTGMQDRLGPERVRSERLDRPLTVNDLKAANTLADWFGFMCSSFSIWGPLTPNGDVLTARNLDFPFTLTLQRSQLVVVRHGAADRAGWVGISWPGLIGVYTAMNAAGVTMLMHDANGLPPERDRPCIPRSLTLRTALEQARPATFITDVQRVFQTHPVIMGNNIHVSAPRTVAAAVPAVVFEYDANHRDAGVTVRMPAAGESAIYCTNHMCERVAPRDCKRYAKLERRLTECTAEHHTLTPEEAFDLLRAVRQRMTLHAVCMLPHERRLLVQFPPLNEQIHEFDVAQWLRHTTSQPATGN